MIKGKLDKLKKDAQKRANAKRGIYYVLSNGKIVSADGFVIDPQGQIKVEYICFPQ